MKSLPRSRGIVVALLASALVTSACGLKQETKDSLAAGGGTAGGGAAVDPSTGEVIDSGAGVGTDAGAGVDTGTGTDAGAGTGTDTGTTGGAAGGAAGGSGGAAAGGGGAAGGSTGGSTGGGGAAAPEAPGDDGDTTGIKGNSVHIKLHGPLTGAGVPQESFRSGTPKYWKTHKLANGMSVVAEAIDDKYNAPDAARACQAAAKDSFLIVGGAGTDQIASCAQTPAVKRGVPYLSVGVTENGLKGLNHYFATTLTYRQQAKHVVQMASDYKYLNGRKWAVVITDTPNFNDARAAILEELKKKGIAAKVFLTDKAPSNCTSLSSQIRNQYDAIYFLGQPSFFAQCVGAIGYTPAYKPIYTGPGPSFGINTVGKLACSGSANQYQGYYLNPAPGLDTAPKLAPGVSFADDIEYQIYGAMESLKQAFDLVKGKLTREKFIAALAAGGTQGGIFSPTKYAGGDRFGGTGVYGVKMNCAKGVQETLKKYVG